jgi:hypothetical protein
MMLSLRRIFRRATKHNFFFTADCDKQELTIWHELADISDYVRTIDDSEKTDTKTKLFNVLADAHGWPMDADKNQMRTWLDGMFNMAHEIGPKQHFTKHFNKFLSRDQLDESFWGEEGHLTKNSQRFMQEHYMDMALALNAIK